MNKFTSKTQELYEENVGSIKTTRRQFYPRNFELSEEFLDAFSRSEEAGALYVNPRFVGGPPEFASSASRQEAHDRGQFRIKDIRDPKTRDLAIVLEHELDSCEYVCFKYVVF